MQHNIVRIGGLAAGAALILSLSAPLALAQTGGLGAQVNVSAQAQVGSTSVRARVSATLIARAKSRADQEIDRRTAMLARLEARLGQMERLSASEQQSLNAEVQTQISELSALKVKIAADTDVPTLRADIKSIIDSYRIYILVVPQTAILAAVDRVDTLVGDFNMLGGRLSARISQAQSSGANVSAAQSAYADYQAKVADASLQASAAQSAVENLQPDNGVASVRQSNTAALKDAHTKFRAARQDLVAARKDVTRILRALPKASGSAGASAAASSSSAVSH